MCLILENDSVKTIAHTDIIVYKVVEKVRTRMTGPSDTFYRSSFYRFDYEKDVMYCGKLRKSTSLYSDTRTIENGFHSYERLEDAERNTNPYSIVVKCIIPAGSEFYKGHGVDFTPQYASNKIMIKEEV